MTNGESASFGEMDMRTTLRSSTTTELLPNPHPGEILQKEFLEPMALSQTALARAIGVSPRRINEIVLGKRAITADTDLRLARYFAMSEGFFLGLQADYELMQQRRKIGNQLKAIRPRAA
jgi:addiction module HigA family antidote